MTSKAHLISLYGECDGVYPALTERFGHEASQLRQQETFADWRWIMADWRATGSAVVLS